MNRLCEESGTYLLIDIPNLYINAKNHRFCPYEWIKQIDPQFVKQFHIIGVKNSHHNGKEVFFDTHSEDMAKTPELTKLIQYAYEILRPELVILERDDHFTDLNSLIHDMSSLNLKPECEILMSNI